MKKPIILAALWAALSGQFIASAQLKGLDFLRREPLKKVFSYSLHERKPVAVFVYSEKCFESRQFARQVMHQPEIGELMKHRMNCVLADVNLSEGKDFANKNRLYVMPAMLMYSADQKLQYKCKLSLRPAEVLRQLEAFVVASNLRNQIMNLVQTSDGLSYNEASRRIGESYARMDFRKGNDSGSIEERCNRYTLGQDYLLEFEKGYKECWQKLLAEADRKKNLKVQELSKH